MDRPCIFLFATTHETIRAERLAQEKGFDVTVIPQPPGRTGRCGVALQGPPGAAAALRELFLAAGFDDVEVVE